MVKIENYILIRAPRVFKKKVTSTLAVRDIKAESPVFLENIIKEKQFDIRQSLMEEAYKDGIFFEEVESTDDELTLTTIVKLYEK